MQPNLTPFGNPFLLNGDLSGDGFQTPPASVLFLVPFLLFQGGSGMDLSKVGEKILSSVRSARSLGLLPPASDRPEVPELECLRDEKLEVKNQMVKRYNRERKRSADHSVRMFDRRNLTSGGVGAPIYKFVGHTAAVLCVQWSPDKSSVFGSSAEDGLLNIWDYEKVSKKERTSKNSTSPPGLFFQHAGHRDKVVDFHWNASDPWTVVSVSDDCDTTGGGGTLQIWRMSDLIYRPEEEVLEELEKFKSHVISCAKPVVSALIVRLPEENFIF